MASLNDGLSSIWVERGRQSIILDSPTSEVSAFVVSDP